MDTFVKLLSDERLFPKLEAITLLGHSAGGQFVQRYALMTVLPTAPRAGLSVRYVIANPSSFAYLDASRPVYSCGKYAAHSGVAPLPPSTAARSSEPRRCLCNYRGCTCSDSCSPTAAIREGALPFKAPGPRRP